MDGIWKSLVLLIFGALIIPGTANGDQPQWTYSGNNTNWGQVSNVSDRYLGWNTYNSQELGGNYKKAELQIEILQGGNFSFSYNKTGGGSTHLYLWKNRKNVNELNDNDWTDYSSTISVKTGDILKWRLEVSSPSAKAQAWIAIPPPGIVSPPPPIPIPPAGANGIVPLLEERRTPPTPGTPSGPAIGYTNSQYSYSADIVGSREDIDYQFEWDGLRDNQSEDAQGKYSWTTPGQKNVRVRAINRQGNASNWSDPKVVVIFDQINVTDHLQNAINDHVSYAEIVLQNDQNDISELSIIGKNNISIISRNGNKFKLAGQATQNKVKIINSKNIIIKQLTISNSGGIGIKLDNCHYCTISDNDIKFGQGKTGISISGNDNTIRDNILENVTGTCSAYSDGILIEKGENNIILNNIIKKQNNCRISSYSLNTTGPFKIVVSNLQDFPIQLFIGYRDPICTCDWHKNGTITCATNGNAYNRYHPQDNDPDAFVWSTFLGSNQ